LVQPPSFLSHPQAADEYSKCANSGRAATCDWPHLSRTLLFSLLNLVGQGTTSIDNFAIMLKI
jgi:hypothetical protein